MSDEWLCALFAYDPDTGDITYKLARGAMRVGDVAGTVGTSGYIQIMTNGKKYLAHRLAWFLHTGAWPDMDLDHINRDRCDNRWDNLRQATRKENQSNRDIDPAYAYSVGNRWRAQRKVNGKVKHLGYFDTYEEAYKVASR